jgi:acetylornithine deacetylase/succinyl-diaminopimelate desuccinylase-like protein
MRLGERSGASSLKSIGRPVASIKVAGQRLNTITGVPAEGVDEEKMISSSSSVIDYVRGNQDRYLSELKEYLSIPSISTLPENKKDVERAAQWLKSQLDHIGFVKAEVMPTGGHPVVYGEWLRAAAGSPTVLIYGHYDVQPVDPLNEWTSPPFTPTVRGDEVFARGSADMKGQGHALLKSLEGWMTKTGSLPVNVKFFFEGEEEIGSPHLDAFIEKNKEKLNCKFCLNCDGSVAAPDKPSMVYGLRGLVYFDVSVRGSESDLHSGRYGGAVANPAVVLAELIAGLHDKDARVTLTGFYDKVRDVPRSEREELISQGPTDEEWRKAAGVTHLYGEKGFTSTERVGTRPTLEVNGMISGFTGEGQKTVLPAKASAKISMRTVPYQDADQIDASLREYFTKNAPPTVTWEVKRVSSSPFAIVERGTPELVAASKALEESYGAKPIFELEGGSVPVVAMLKNRLGVNSVLMGCGLADAKIHAPNEGLHLPTYYRGIEAYARFFDLISR